MGIYLNPGNKGFREAVNSEIYVDKTGLISLTNKYINTEQKYICVSRPRRFGKSMALKMLAGERVRVNPLTYQNDMCNFKVKDDVLTLLVHLGYLGYDSQTEEVFIPNKEIVREFENAMRVGGWTEVMRV